MPLDPAAIRIGRTYRSARDLQERLVIAIGPEIRPQSTADAEQRDPGPGVRWRQVGGTFNGVIDESTLGHFAAWADSVDPDPDMPEPETTYIGGRE